MISNLFQLLCIGLLLRVLWSFLHHRFVSSTLDNLPGPDAESWFNGNFLQIFNSNAWEFHGHLAKQYGHAIRVNSFLGERQLYIFDPKAMHNILVKDQAIFEETDGFTHGNALVFGPGLLGTLGDQHRKQRRMLSPVFSAAHMRDMVPTFNTIAHKLRDTIAKKIKGGSPEQEIEILSWMARTALELIGQSGLGYSFDSLSDDASAHPYSGIVKELVPAQMRMWFMRDYVIPWAVKIGPSGFRRFIMDTVPIKRLHHIRDMSDYMHKLSVEIYESKKRALEQGDEYVERQVGNGKDVLSVLMKANLTASNEDRLSEEEVISQMSTLIFAAMDTTSSALARVLHLLARHPDVQDKLRKELLEAHAPNGGNLTYNELEALPYLDAICRETLRLYSPVSFALRTARRDAVIPLHTPVTGRDGNSIKEILVSRGTSIIMSILNSNRNPALWGPDALEWKPERWLSPLPSALVDARMPGVYSHLMTFLGGGRSCIGFKFSQLEMKAVLSTLVASFKFAPSDRDSEIFWQMNGITAPVVGKDLHPQLPLKVSLAN